LEKAQHERVEAGRVADQRLREQETKTSKPYILNPKP
jgi:hypothetical protein